LQRHYRTRNFNGSTTDSERKGLQTSHHLLGGPQVDTLPFVVKFTSLQLWAGTLDHDAKDCQTQSIHLEQGVDSIGTMVEQTR